MSIREQIALLEQLVGTDVEIRRIEEELEKDRSGLDALKREQVTLEARLTNDLKMITDMEKTRMELATEAKQMLQQMERSKEKLGRSRNERETNAAQRELEELRRLHEDRNHEVQKLTKLVEAARETVRASETRRDELNVELGGSEQGTLSKLSELENEKQTLVRGRAETVAKLPSLLYRRYESIRTKKAVAVAKTHDGTCLGCHMSIPPMMFQKMRSSRPEFEQCPHCKRILYYVAPPTASADDVNSNP